MGKGTINGVPTLSNDRIQMTEIAAPNSWQTEIWKILRMVWIHMGSQQQ